MNRETRASERTNVIPPATLVLQKIELFLTKNRWDPQNNCSWRCAICAYSAEIVPTTLQGTGTAH